MGSLAQLAKQAGFKVSGCDSGVYPPMSTQLEKAGIQLIEGFGEEQLRLKPDLFVIGNVVSRGNPLMEAILNKGLSYVSGPQWLAENILPGRWVLGVSGTHGKTTTTSMLSWILEYAGFKPGFLVGGVPENFGVSARLGESDFFVIEADEYDTAFFDKRSKFVHYKPRTLIINNLEFDHADIFDDIAAIQKQFHHLIRTVASDGMVLYPQGELAIEQLIDMGCWSDTQVSGLPESTWYALQDKRFVKVYFGGEKAAGFSWELDGQHNVQNALHAIAAARHIGIDPAVAAEALSEFRGVKRRMELVGCHREISVYDDFAHHPTAVALTLEGLRARVGDAPIIAVVEPRSNTMKLGTHKEALLDAVSEADRVYWFEDSNLAWSIKDHVQRADNSSQVYSEHSALIEAVMDEVIDGAHIVVMSNGGFANMPATLLNALRSN